MKNRFLSLVSCSFSICLFVASAAAVEASISSAAPCGDDPPTLADWSADNCGGDPPAAVVARTTCGDDPPALAAAVLTHRDESGLAAVVRLADRCGDDPPAVSRCGDDPPAAQLAPLRRCGGEPPAASRCGGDPPGTFAATTPLRV